MSNGKTPTPPPRPIKTITEGSVRKGGINKPPKTPPPPPPKGQGGKK